MKMHKRMGGLRNVRVYDRSVCGGMWEALNGLRRTYITDDETKVTCKTCLHIMRKKK